MRIGIDLGGTKTEIIALDAHGRTVLRRRCATPADDYHAALDTIVALVNAAEQTLGTTASVGIGIPGSLSPANGRVRNANSTCLNGQAFQSDINARLGREVRIANDANCMAMSEACDGAGKGAESVFGVILGTGVGGGVVIQGQLLQGVNRIAGEWGHNPLPPENADDLPAMRCHCGRVGCVETWLSGPGMAAEHTRLTGQALSPADIAAHAAAGDSLAQASMQRYERRLARALASVINILDPEVIVLGGGLSNIDCLYANVPRLWCEHVFSDVIVTRLVKCQHGDSSGVRGAAWLWPAHPG